MMPDNTKLNTATLDGGDSIRTVAKTGAKTQVVTLDLGGSGAEALISATPATTGAVPISKTSVTQVVSTALEASRVLKASSGSLVSLMVTNTKASSQWVLVMNSTTVPADGAVTLLLPPIAIGAAETIRLEFDTPIVASTGIAVCNSSTGTFTKTVGAADLVIHAQVI